MPGLHQEALLEAGIAGLELLGQLRSFGPGSNEADVALPHVDDLRQLVEGSTAEERANRGDPGIVFLGPNCAGVPFGVRDHGPELVHPEDSSVLAQAFLCVEDGTTVVQPDRKGIDTHRTAQIGASARCTASARGGRRALPPVVDLDLGGLC